MTVKLIIKWLALLPLSLLTTLAAWALCPILPLFADKQTHRLPAWCEWASTPYSTLLGDAGHQARWRGRPQYLQEVAWIWRNPARVAQMRPPLGFVVEEGDIYHSRGDELTADNGGGHAGSVLRWIERDGKPVCFQLYVVHRWGKSNRCFRWNAGWKLWQAPPVGHAAQITGRIAPFKHFG